jgi:hypothetical protein
VLGGDVEVSRPLVQAGTHRVEPVMVAEPRRKLLDGAQPDKWAVDLADRDRAAERGNRNSPSLKIRYSPECTAGRGRGQPPAAA